MAFTQDALHRSAWCLGSPFLVIPPSLPPNFLLHSEDTPAATRELDADASATNSSICRNDAE